MFAKRGEDVNYKGRTDSRMDYQAPLEITSDTQLLE
jgi:hypothetical protein